MFEQRSTNAWVAIAAAILVACSSDAPETSSNLGQTGGANAGGAAGTMGSGTAGSQATTGAGGASAGSQGDGGAGATGGGGNNGASDASIAVEASASDAASADVPAGAFTLTSTGFKEGETIPILYKCPAQNGMNQSPPLAWTPGPASTKSYAMTLIHDAPDMSVHWVLWDIPASTLSLPVNVEQVASPSVPAGSKQAKPNLDGSTWFGYQGPCPQAAGVTQSYLFAVYALDVATLPGVTSQSTNGAILTAVKAHQVARATLSGQQIRTQ